jgi:HD superfamily phosphodiesterase
MLDMERMQNHLITLGGTYILNHARRTLVIARRLAALEKLAFDEDILVFVCYFHDVSVFKPYRPEGQFDHAEESSKLMPAFAADYGIHAGKIDTIVEAVKFHDKRGQGTANETKLLRNADAIDYLGFIAVARDFSKQPNEMSKAMTALKKHRNDFTALLELDAAIEMAEPRIRNLDIFLSDFEQESFGLY